MVYYLISGVLNFAERDTKQRYTPEFKQQVVGTMRKEGLGHREAERRFGLSHKRAATWERIYLEEGSEGLP